MILYRQAVHTTSLTYSQAVYETVDVTKFLQDLATLVERTSLEAGETSRSDLFAQFEDLLQAFRAMVRKKLIASGVISPKTMGNEDTSGQNWQTLESVDFGNYMWVGSIFVHSPWRRTN